MNRKADMTYEEVVSDPILSAIRDVAEETHTPIIRRDTEKYFCELLSSRRPSRILEIGSGVGYSAIFFVSIVPEAVVYSIEKDEYAIAIARHNIEAAGKDGSIRLIFGDGEEQIEKLRDLGEEPFDLIFIDAGKSHYRRFFDAAISLAKPGTIILSDDVGQRGLSETAEELLPRKHRTAARKMKEYIAYLETAPDIKTEFLEIGDGLALTKYLPGKESLRSK